MDGGQQAVPVLKLLFKIFLQSYKFILHLLDRILLLLCLSLQLVALFTDDPILVLISTQLFLDLLFFLSHFFQLGICPLVLGG